MRRIAIPLSLGSLLVLLLQAYVLPGAVRAQTAQQASEPLKYEFRGAWIATVLRLDWPPADASAQQAKLAEQMEALKETGINAVFFQVRSEADAMYESSLEPWSYWLTGEQGKAPEPFFDPLELAIEEAHRRGIELHAWFNPYRAVRGSGYANSSDHVSKTHPEWMLTFGSLKTLNPGLPEVREHIVKVIVDVATRYDVDGVHFDDYFYPYPPNHISNEDAQTFAEHNRGFNDIDAWRRDNINLLIEQVSDTLNALKPHVKFGISPFGIWKNGVPSGIVGLDAYNVIYGDALSWLSAQWIDYLVPQLYWAFGGGQDYGKLAPWWADQMNGRHLYTGHGVYRADPNTFSGTLFSASEIPNQIRFNRGHEGILGSVFFRTRNLTQFSTKGLADSLKADFYRNPALPPVMGWKDIATPDPPQALAYAWTDDGGLALNWEVSAKEGSEGGVARFAVYRVLAELEPDPDSVAADPANLIAVTGKKTYIDRPELADDTYFYHVRSVTRNSVESTASNVVSLSGAAVATEIEVAPQFELFQNYPNPFSESTTISFRLAEPSSVTLTIYDALGRVVDTPVNRSPTSAGLHRVKWDRLDSSGRPLGTGTYFYTLKAGGRQETRGMIVLQ